MRTYMYMYMYMYIILILFVHVHVATVVPKVVIAKYMYWFGGLLRVGPPTCVTPT